MYYLLATTDMLMLQEGLQNCLVKGKLRKHICKGAYNIIQDMPNTLPCVFHLEPYVLVYLYVTMVVSSC